MARPPHEVLGIPRGATVAEVKRAFRRKARLHHPDLNPHRAEAAAAAFREVAEAYEQLRDGDGYGGDAYQEAPRRRAGTASRPRSGYDSTRRNGGDASARGARSSGAGRRTPRAFDPRVLSREPMFIIAAHIRGLRALHWCVTPAALVAAALPALLGDMPSDVTLWPFVPAWAIAWITQRAFLAVAARYEPGTSVGHAVKETWPLLAAAGLGLLTWRLLSAVPLDFRTEVGAMAGAMITAYLAGRVWDQSAKLISFVIGAVVGLPIALFALLVVLLFPLDQTNPAHTPPDGAHMIGALVGMVVGGLVCGIASQLLRRTGLQKA